MQQEEALVVSFCIDWSIVCQHSYLLSLSLFTIKPEVGFAIFLFHLPAWGRGCQIPTGQQMGPWQGHAHVNEVHHSGLYPLFMHSLWISSTPHVCQPPFRPWAKAQGASQKKRQKECTSRRMGAVLWNAVLYLTWLLHTWTLKQLWLPIQKPAQIKPCKHPSLEEEGVPVTPHLAEEILVLCGY